MMKEQFSIGLGAVMGVLSYFVGGFDPLLSVFATTLVIDTLTGMLKAWNAGEYQSSKFRKGFVKKSGYLIGVILAVQIDILIGGNGALRDAVLTFFVANESFSILENLGQMGVQLPQAFMDALKVLGKEKTQEEISHTEE